jgi:acid stress chaperone HdeB
MKKSALKLLVGVVSTFFLAPVATAQVTIDIGKITCEQFISFSVTDPNNIAIWLSGYRHGQHTDTIVRPQEFKEDIARLKSACFLRENSKLRVVQVAEKVLSSK